MSIIEINRLNVPNSQLVDEQGALTEQTQGKTIMPPIKITLNNYNPQAIKLEQPKNDAASALDKLGVEQGSVMPSLLGRLMALIVEFENLKSPEFEQRQLTLEKIADQLLINRDNLQHLADVKAALLVVTTVLSYALDIVSLASASYKINSARIGAEISNDLKNELRKMDRAMKVMGLLNKILKASSQGAALDSKVDVESVNAFIKILKEMLKKQEEVEAQTKHIIEQFYETYKEIAKNISESRSKSVC